MKKLAIVYGGQSTEHKVSCNSAFGVLRAIDFSKYEIDLIYISREGKWFSQPKLKKAPSKIDELTVNTHEVYDLNLLRNYDVAMPILHGEKGEDGTIQGLFEVFNVKYVGNGIFSSATSIDKVLTKKICGNLGVPQVPYVAFEKFQWDNNKKYWLDEVEKLEYPAFVKPPKLGSSIGITKAKNRIEVEQAIDIAFSYGSKVLIEKGVTAREVEIGALGNTNVELSVIGEVALETGDYYDFDAKYESNTTQLVIPAPITNSVEQQLKDYAQRIYKVLECKGLARLDFFLEENGTIYFNEINTFPGFTSKSMYPQLWEKTGISYSKLIDQLISLALHTDY